MSDRQGPGVELQDAQRVAKNIPEAIAIELAQHLATARRALIYPLRDEKNACHEERRLEWTRMSGAGARRAPHQHTIIFDHRKGFVPVYRVHPTDKIVVRVKLSQDPVTRWHFLVYSYQRNLRL